jgi:large subunit ribosomal protein L10Ae
MSSKISNKILDDAVDSILYNSSLKKRKFNESIELQIGIKNYDPKKDKRFSGTTVLPNIIKDSKNIAILGDALHISQASEQGLDSYSIDDLKKFNKQKKPIKKFAKKYDFFLASDSIIKTIPRVLGPGLNKAGKFPSLITHNDDLKKKVNVVKSSIKIELKKVLCFGLTIGNVKMKKDKIVENLSIAINFLVSLLKKNWQNIKSLHIKSTMNKPVKIY